MKENLESKLQISEQSLGRLEEDMQARVPSMEYEIKDLTEQLNLTGKAKLETDSILAKLTREFEDLKVKEKAASDKVTKYAKRNERLRQEKNQIESAFNDLEQETIRLKLVE